MRRVLQTAGRFGPPLAGLASPVVLATAVIVVAAGRGDYSQLRDAVSELGAVGRPGAVSLRWLGVIPAGALTSIAAIASYRMFGAGRLSRIGGWTQALAGLAFVGTGLCPWTGAARDLTPLGNQLHLVLALLGFLLLALAPAMFGLGARQGLVRRWGSLIAAAAIFACGFLLARPPYLGLFQRGALAAFYLWLVVVCLADWRRGAAASG